MSKKNKVVFYSTTVVMEIPGYQKIILEGICVALENTTPALIKQRCWAFLSRSIKQPIQPEDIKVRMSIKRVPDDFFVDIMQV